MLEDLAIRYINNSEGELRAIAYGLTILGAIVAAVVTHSKSELRRAPYFAYSGLLFFAVSAIQFLWFGSLSARAGEWLAKHGKAE